MPSMHCTQSPSAAKLFVQLTTRPTPQPLSLEFLVPRPALAAATSRSLSNRRKRTTNAPLSPTKPTGSSSRPAAPWQRPPEWPAPRVVRALSASTTRPFSYTTARAYTQAAYNPLKDDKGDDMTLEITPRAAKRLSEIMAKDSNPHLALRIQVESGGCHGFQYLMSLVTLPPTLPSRPAQPAEHPGEGADSGTIREDDTIFTFSNTEQPQPPQGADLAAAPKVILDQPSLELLKGSKVDFTMELIGSQFKIVDNPLATSSCGCGTSFDIKI